MGRGAGRFGAAAGATGAGASGLSAAGTGATGAGGRYAVACRGCCGAREIQKHDWLGVPKDTTLTDLKI